MRALMQLVVRFVARTVRLCGRVVSLSLMFWCKLTGYILVWAGWDDVVGE